AITAFEAVDRQLLDAARTLGAGPARTFFRVALPLGASGPAARCALPPRPRPPPALAAGWVLASARGIGEFGATIVFAGSVRGETQTLTLAIYEQLEASFDVALSIGILLGLISAFVLISYKLLSWRRSSSTSPIPFAASSSAAA